MSATTQQLQAGTFKPPANWPTAPQNVNGPPTTISQAPAGTKMPAINEDGSINTGNAPGVDLPPGSSLTAPKQGAAPNGLANFANSALGQYMSQHAAPATMQNYLPALQQAFGSARSDINMSLAGALSDIKANQQFAQQALGQLPGQINQSYGTADQLMNNGQHVAQQGMNAPGLNAATAANTGGSLSQYMQPVRAAIAGEKAGEMANVPLLGTGINQAASQEAAAANNAALSDYGNLAQQAAGIQGQLGIAAMNQQTAQAQQGNQNIFGLLQGAQNNKYTLSQIAAQNAAAQSPYAGLTQGQVAQAQRDPQYKELVNQILSGQVTTKQQARQGAPANPIVWQLLAGQYGLK